MIGGTNSDRSKPAWKQVYRSLDHNDAKKACLSNDKKNKQKHLQKFPKEIEDFGNMFVSMQEKRHLADYSPEEKYAKSAVSKDIGTVEATIAAFNKVRIKDRRAFAAFVLFKLRD